MTLLDPLWRGDLAPGLYQLKSRYRSALILAEVAAHGWQPIHLAGQSVIDKPSFLRACAEAMRFPAYFGNNWDALADMLGDLSWLPAQGYVLLYDHADTFARHSPAEWEIAQTILAETAAYWGARGTPFYVLFRGMRAAHGLPPLAVRNG